jgi:peptide/nickel transport system ATP-binding protein
MAGEREAGVPVLEVEDLSVVYQTEQGQVEPVRKVSLAVHPREGYGLVGESGSGKTTLALASIRYLPGNGRVTGGGVRLNGTDLLGLPASEMRRVWGSQVAMVYQNPGPAMNPSLTIGRQLSEVARTHLGMAKGEARERSLEMLERVRMADPQSVLKRYPHQVSGGMLQRCVIAMALMTNPALLIMDEPTTALDVTTQAVILDLVSDLKHEFDAAILYITHDLGVVARICERVGVMYAGELVEEGTTAQLYHRPRHPYTLKLLSCMPEFSMTQGARVGLHTIPGSIPRLDELPEGCVFSPRCDLAEEACRAARPPLRPVASGQTSACRRWEVVPYPAVSAAEGEAAESESGTETRALEACDIKKYYPGPGRFFGFGGDGGRSIKAVDGVHVWVNRGRTLGVVGESGSGKTTLARVIAGLVPPTEGSVTLGTEVLAPTTQRRRRDQLARIQMVFQNPDSSLNPRHTVAEAIARPLRLLGKTGRGDVPARVLELLDSVHLAPTYYDRLPGELSGGEKQRVAIARAFAADPEVVLCDEPLSALDVSVQGALMNLLVDLQREGCVSYLFISHDLAAVQHLSDWIAVVYLGAVMELGDASQVLNPPYHPYTEALLSAIPIPDPDVQARPIRLPGSVPSAVDIPTGCRFHTRCPRFIGDVCVREEPPWREGSGHHWISCHWPLEELATMQAHVFGPEGDR